MLRNVYLIATSSVLVAGIALGAEESPAKFRLGHGVFTHKSESVEKKPKTGPTAKESNSYVDTFAGGFEFYVSKGKYNLYVFPGQLNSSPVYFGYSLTESVEMGLSLKVTSSSVGKPKDASDTTETGVYAIYYHTCPGGVLEATINPVFGNSSSKKHMASGATEKSTVGMTQFNVSALFDVAIDANWHYFASLLYAMDSRDDTGDVKMKTTTTTIAVTPVGFRYWL